MFYLAFALVVTLPCKRAQLSPFDFFKNLQIFVALKFLEFLKH